MTRPDKDNLHRVYLPGPHRDELPQMIEHSPGCDPDACPVLSLMAEAIAARPGFRYQVQGDYWTTDGIHFERCAWQPGRRT